MLIVVLLGVVLGFGNNVMAQNSSVYKTAARTATGDLIPVQGTSANASPTADAIANIVAWILYYIATFFSWFVALLIQTLVLVATYNKFLDQQVVINGWGIVRDVANNFFIVILLVIAVGTILRVPNYNRQLLPKLLVMAVLINFSKMFTGILIDFSQVLTLWFATKIKEIGNEGNILLFALGLDKLYRLNVSNIKWTAEIPGIDAAKAIRTMLFALILSVVAVVVVAIIIIILIYRIIMLWFLVILSPLAFLLTTFPKGQQYAGMWWSELAKYLVVGPVMLFFLYLSFFSGSVNVGSPSGFDKDPGTIPTAGGAGDTTNNPTIKPGDAPPGLGLTQMETPAGIIDFLIIIGLMVGSLVAGQKTGVAGAQWAGKGISTLQKLGKGATVGLSQKVGIGTAKRVGTGALGVSGALLTKTPLGRVDSFKKVGEFAGAYRGDLLKTRAKAKTDKREKLFKKLGMGDEAVEAWGGVANSRLGQGAKLATQAAVGVGALAAGAATGGLAWIPAMAASAAAFSPLLKTVVAKGEKNRKGQKENSEIKRDADKEQLKTSKDKAVSDQDDYLKTETVKQRALIDHNVFDAGTGNGLDKRVQDRVIANNGGTAPAIFSKPLVDAARKEIFSEVATELKDLHKTSVEGLNKGFERDKESADKSHETRVQAIGDPTWMQKQWGDYHPNKVTMDTVKKITKEKADIEKLIASLAGGADISGFGKSTFHAESGQTARHERFFKSLSDGSDKSVNALRQMSSTLQTIQNGILAGNSIKKEEAGNLVGLKQGLAAYKKGGGDVSHFSQIIADLNKIKTHDISTTNDKLAKTVEDHESTVITK